MHALAGKTALVEGASTPVGAAVSRALADAGAVVGALDVGPGTADGLVAGWALHGIVDIYVHTGPWAGVPRRSPLVALDDEGFAGAFERPVLTLLWSKLFFKERITTAKVSAIAVILCGLVCIGLGAQ